MDHTEVIRCPRENANLVVAELALLLAFEAGRLAGQVDLEESYDLSQMADCVIEVAYSQKNAMPLKSASVGRTVTVNLRSDTWRQELRKTAKDSLDKATCLLLAQLNSPMSKMEV